MQPIDDPGEAYDVALSSGEHTLGPQSLSSPGALAEPPPRHQRRFLIQAGSPAQVDDWLLHHCVQWQHEYPGGLFISLRSAMPEHSVAALISLFRAAGCNENMSVFYRSSRLTALPELAGLIRAVRRKALAVGFGPASGTPPGEDALSGVAEVLGIGATDTIAIPETVLAPARGTALMINELLHSSEVAIPEGFVSSPPRSSSTAWRNAAPAGAKSDDIGSMLRAGEQLASLECEQLMDLLHDYAESSPAPGIPSARTKE